MSVATDREIYVLGKELDGNREVVVVEVGEDNTDLPASAKFAYSVQSTQFPYNIAA